MHIFYVIASHQSSLNMKNNVNFDTYFCLINIKILLMAFNSCISHLFFNFYDNLNPTATMYSSTVTKPKASHAYLSGQKVSLGT